MYRASLRSSRPLPLIFLLPFSLPSFSLPPPLPPRIPCIFKLTHQIPREQLLDSRQYELTIAAHCRRNHFGTPSFDRIQTLLEDPRFPKDPLERAATLIDLYIVSVLLDAGAGPDWVYTEKGEEGQEGWKGGRSEGLAVASWHIFVDGVFSSSKASPLQVDGELQRRPALGQADNSGRLEEPYGRNPGTAPADLALQPHGRSRWSMQPSHTARIGPRSPARHLPERTARGYARYRFPPYRNAQADEQPISSLTSVRHRQSSRSACYGRPSSSSSSLFGQLEPRSNRTRPTHWATSGRVPHSTELSRNPAPTGKKETASSRSTSSLNGCATLSSKRSRVRPSGPSTEDRVRPVCQR